MIQVVTALFHRSQHNAAGCTSIFEGVVVTQLDAKVTSKVLQAKTARITKLGPNVSRHDATVYPAALKGIKAMVRRSLTNCYAIEGVMAQNMLTGQNPRQPVVHLRECQGATNPRSIYPVDADVHRIELVLRIH